MNKILSILVIVALVASVAQASTILSDHALLDLSSGFHNSNQSQWTVNGGTTLDGTSLSGTTVTASQGHWNNGSLYYIGYTVDGSYTYDPVTGNYSTSGGAGGNPVHGYLSASADTVTIDVNFSTAMDVSVVRFYPAGWRSNVASDFTTDYQLQYKDQNGTYQTVVSRQTVTPSMVPSNVNPATLFYDHDVGTSAKEWRITLINGQGGWQGNATFNEIQFFESSTIPEASNIFLLTLGLVAIYRLRRKSAA